MKILKNINFNLIFFRFGCGFFLDGQNFQCVNGQKLFAVGFAERAADFDIFGDKGEPIFTARFKFSVFKQIKHKFAAEIFNR